MCICSANRYRPLINSAAALCWVALWWLPAAACGQSCEEREKLLALDGGAFDALGFSVSISGHSAIVGAYSDDHAGGVLDAGSAYVFVRTAQGWVQQEKLTASDAAESDFFGASVWISGDSVIVGASGDDDGGTDAGSAYVFTRKGDVWTQEQKITATDAAAADEFGASVSISGDSAIVGAHGDDDGGPMAGAAYVFTRSEGAWSQQQKLTATDAAAADEFGVGVSISSDRAIVGAYRDNDAGLLSGSAYVFARKGSTWTQEQKLIASDGAANDQFGRNVAISAGSAIIGAAGDDDGGSNAGAAYVFVRDDSATPLWTQQQKLIASDAAEGDEFGAGVAISGDAAIVGSHNDDDGGPSSGSAYVFVRAAPPDKQLWTELQKLTASDAAESDQFGISVSISGSAAIVGANGDDDAAPLAGSAYVFQCPAIVLPCPADIVADGDVNVDDLFALLAGWQLCPKPCPPSCPQDINGDCDVNINDLLGVLGAWGPCP